MERINKTIIWIIDIINSCKTPEQVELCEKLIENFYKLHPANHVQKIDDAFHAIALKTNFYQHKMVSKKEKLK